MKTWRCKNCEHKNNYEDISCEICSSKRPILKFCKYELSDVFGVVRIIWETNNAESVTIIKQKKKLYADINDSLLLMDCKNNEKITLLLNNNFAEYKEELIVLLEKPEITLFELERVKLLVGTSTQVKWKTNNSTKTQISGIGKVDNEGTTDLRVEKNPIKITTENEIGIVEKKIEVEFIPLPKIEFDCKRKIELGDTLNLKWSIENSLKSVLLYNESKKEITNIGEKEVVLKENASFKLIATALDNHTIIEKEITVEVFPKPKIKYFKVNPDVALNSMPVTLSWKTQNAKKVEINNGIGEVVAEGKKVALYKENTLYTIIAVGELSIVTKNVIVRVFPTPIIESLLVPMPDFESRISLNPIKIDTPTIDVKINMPDFNLAIPEITEPNIKLSDIQPIYKPYKLLFNFHRLYVYVRNRIREQE